MNPVESHSTPVEGQATPSGGSSHTLWRVKPPLWRVTPPQWRVIPPPESSRSWITISAWRREEGYMPDPGLHTSSVTGVNCANYTESQATDQHGCD